MNTIELEAQKANLAREILCMEDETIINNVMQLLKTSVQQQEKQKKRELGILDGKAKIVFHDDWEMTTEELLGLQ
jgi:ABC-type Zn2+ transport system substrate-binding protein/surface adhesin